MRVTIATWVVVIGGCGFSPSVGVDARPDQVSPGSDQDGDGIDDTVDNCPTIANGDQVDHDLDAIGDVCDRCPFIADAMDPDADHDGVGDGCDPRPQTVGDRRIAFYDFTTPSETGAWVPKAATGAPAWSSASGYASQTNLGAVDAVLVDPDLLDKTYVVASIRLDATTANASVGFCTSVAPAQQYCCTVRADLGVVASSASTATNIYAATPWTGPYTTGTQITLTQNLDTNNHCEARSGATTVSATTLRGPSGGQLELYTSVIKASFDYLFVVQVGS